jgi:outer membrane receptor for Fe3+-dicitrate
MLTKAGNIKLSNQDYIIPERWVWNAGYSVKISKISTFSISIHNMTNKTYAVSSRPAGWRPGMPRNFVISMNNYF